MLTINDTLAQIERDLISRPIRQAWLFPDPCPTELSQLTGCAQGYALEIEGNQILIVGSSDFRTIDVSFIEGQELRQIVEIHGRPLALTPSILDAPLAHVWASPSADETGPALLVLEASPGAALAFSWYIDFDASLLTRAATQPEPRSVFEALLEGRTDLALSIQRREPHIPRDESGRTALHVAATMGNSLFLRSLGPPVKNLNDEDELGHSAFQQACFMGNVGCAKILRQLGARIPNETNSIGSLLANVCRNETFTTLRYLIQSLELLDVDTAEDALITSCQNDATCCTRFLLQEIRKRFSREKHERFLLTSQALSAAVTSNAITSAQMLIEHGFSPRVSPCKDGSLLHLAVKSASVNMVELLLRRGVDPHKRNEAGKTPLDVAIEERRPRFATALRTAMNDEKGEVPKKLVPSLWRNDRFKEVRKAYERRLHDVWYALDERGSVKAVLLEFNLFTLCLYEDRRASCSGFRFSFDLTSTQRRAHSPFLIRASSNPSWRRAIGSHFWALWEASSESRSGELLALSFESSFDLGVCLRTVGKGIDVLQTTPVADCNHPECGLG